MLILAEVRGKSAHCTEDRQQALTLIKPLLKPKRGLSTTYQSREVSVRAVTEKGVCPESGKSIQQGWHEAYLLDGPK